jgi:hypothetical protein
MQSCASSFYHLYLERFSVSHYHEIYETGAAALSGGGGGTHIVCRRIQPMFTTLPFQSSVL